MGRWQYLGLTRHLSEGGEKYTASPKDAKAQGITNKEPCVSFAAFAALAFARDCCGFSTISSHLLTRHSSLVTVFVTCHCARSSAGFKVQAWSLARFMMDGEWKP